MFETSLGYKGEKKGGGGGGDGTGGSCNRLASFAELHNWLLQTIL